MVGQSVGYNKNNNNSTLYICAGAFNMGTGKSTVVGRKK